MIFIEFVFVKVFSDANVIDGDTKVVKLRRNTKLEVDITPVH